MVRICAALAWYDEPPEFLGRCVRSLAGVVDELVALDGAWRWFPQASDHSQVAQHAAIREACDAVELERRVVIPGGIFESQVHKRAELMALAGENADWVLVIDADEYVAHADTAAVRAGLAATDCLIAAVEVENLHRGEQMPGVPAGGGLKRRLYRAGTTVVIVHSGYSFEGKQLLAGEPALDLRAHLRIEHDNCNRGPVRNQRARDYREARQRERVEVWV